MKSKQSVWDFMMVAAIGCGVLAGTPTEAVADEQAPAAAAPASTPPTLLPAMSGPLAADSKPNSYDAGPLGNVYITGVVSGFAQSQNNVVPGDRSSQADVSNAQIFLNKPTGLVQYFIQAGSYSLPDIGAPYIRAGKATNGFYEPFSQGYLKLAPNDNFSIMAGKLPTLIGAEYTFSFENMNVERGLLWNQENAVNRGVQVNYAAGPVALSASWNDGLYSDIYSWAWLSATWTIDKADTLAVIGGGNTKHTTVSTLATPGYLNNEQIYNVIYTHTSGAWTIQPYLQYTRVPVIPEIGAFHSASTVGAALLANYTFDATSNVGGLSLSGFSSPVRVEYISSTGSVANGAPNLMYGPGSKAWSITVTPTYQLNSFFARAEFSYVGAKDTTQGLAFGSDGNAKSQTRGLLEIGILF
jgi:Putative beta-barrel porin-2, OmpL-like. bbp2